MPNNYETMSDNVKSFDWKSLPPGNYEMQGNEFVPVDDSKTDLDAASDNFVAALRRLT